MFYGRSHIDFFLIYFFKICRQLQTTIWCACVICGCRYRVQYSYKPRNPDELELHAGDVVYVVETCADGWYIGTCERTQEFGTFPGNYVQRMR